MLDFWHIADGFEAYVCSLQQAKGIDVVFLADSCTPVQAFVSGVSYEEADALARGNELPLRYAS